jgi:hypothetical protein
MIEYFRNEAFKSVIRKDLGYFDQKTTGQLNSILSGYILNK